MNEIVAPLLEVRDLCVAFGEDGGREVVRHVDLDLRPGEILGIVGASGSGKTTTLRAIVGHLPRGARVTAGTVRFQGVDLVTLRDADLRRVRGRKIAMIVQNPASALNPLRTVGDQIKRLANDRGQALDRDAVRSHLRMAGISDHQRILGAYPHELSGGLAQRVLIANALVAEPVVILADEPTSALDVTIQAQIMELLRSLVDERDLSIIFVTHDIALVGEYCERVAVMNRGEIVEQGRSEDVIYGPAEEYTRHLVNAARPAETAHRHGAPAI
jgi:ABC-type glutathione transport system ATPase component